MKKPFLAELGSFESEVLGEIPAAINKCLFSGCRVKKIMELLVAWEQKSSENRMGFATKEYAEELKIKYNKLILYLSFSQSFDLKTAVGFKPVVAGPASNRLEQLA